MFRAFFLELTEDNSSLSPMHTAWLPAKLEATVSLILVSLSMESADAWGVVS